MQSATRGMSRSLLPHEPRRLVLDEDINWKLAKELRSRGLRNASSNKELQLLGKKDGQLIKALAEQHEPCVLVAWDNKMHLSHAEALRHFGLTLAVIDEHAERGDLTPEEYYREVIHRWAHRMVFQNAGAVVKYSRARGSRIELRAPALVAG
jgi:hypothetical protein